MPNVNDQKAAKAAAYADLIKSRIADLKPMKDYAADFAADCKANHPRISTGLLSFDIALNGGLAEELYIMSAETSTGKSAFMMSVAQHIAESGINVLYFAMEMGKKEFTARGISTISYEHSFHDKMATTVPATVAMLQVMGAFAELERAMISARVKSGLQNARAKGHMPGRPATTADSIPASFYKYYIRYKCGDIGKTELAKLYGCSRTTSNKYIKLIESVSDLETALKKRMNYV